MLTYESLKTLFYREKESPSQLVPLPADFAAQARSYLQTKEKMGGDRWELEDAKNCLHGILETRMRKILLLGLDFVRAGVQPANLTAEERDLFQRIVAQLKTFQEQTSLERRPLPRAVADIPAFVAPDLSTCGPFAAGQEVAVAPDVEALLLKKGLIA